MKRYRATVIAIGLLAALICAYFIINQYFVSSNTDDGGITYDPKFQILKLDREKVAEVIYDGKAGHFEFRKVNGQWEVVYPENFKFNRNKVNLMVNQICNYMADQVIEENAYSLSQYGLDKPAVTVTLKMDDGNEVTVEVGNQSPVGTGYYTKLKDSDTVYFVINVKGEALVFHYTDIKERLLFKDSIESVVRMSLDRDGEKVFDMRRLSLEQWELVEPIQANVDIESLGLVLSSVTEYEVKEYVERDAADLSKYGLDNPRYRLVVESENGEKMDMLLGKERVKGMEIYGKLADDSDVFVIDTARVYFIDKPLKEMVEAFACLVRIDSITGFDVYMDGKVIKGEIRQSDRDEEFYVNGTKVEAVDRYGYNYFKLYYLALIGVRMSDVEIGADPQGEPEVSIVYHLKGGEGDLRIDFVPKNANQYYVLKNGKYSNLVVNRKEFDNVRAEYEKLMDSIKK